MDISSGKKNINNERFKLWLNFLVFLKYTCVSEQQDTRRSPNTTSIRLGGLEKTIIFHVFSLWWICWRRWPTFPDISKVLIFLSLLARGHFSLIFSSVSTLRKVSLSRYIKVLWMVKAIQSSLGMDNHRF